MSPNTVKHKSKMSVGSKYVEAITNVVHDTVTESVIVTNLTGEIIYWNKGAEDIFDYTESQAIGKNISIIYLSAHRKTLRNDLKKIRDGQIYDGEWSGIRKDGSRVWTDTQTIALQDSQGQAIGFIGISRDITKRKEIEEELMVSERRFRTIMEQSPLSIQLFTPDGETLKVNRSWEKLWGTRLQDIKGYNILEDEQLREKGVMPLIRKAFHGEAVQIPPVAYEPDKTVKGITKVKLKWVRAWMYPITDRRGEIRQVVLVHQDITNEHLSEERMQYLASVAQSISDAVIATDNDYKITNWNKGAESLYGWSAVEVIGKRAHDIIPTQIVNGRQGESVQYDKNGREIYILSSTSVIKDAQKNVIGAVAINRDITARKKAEESLKFLAEASKILASSLDYQATLESVAQMAVSYIADWCAVDILEDGEVKQVVVAHKKPKRVQFAHKLRRENPVRLDSESGLGKVLRTGVLEFIPVITGDMIAKAAKTKKELKILQKLGLSSLIIVPLQIDRKTIGALSFVLSESNRYFNEFDLNLAEQLAERASSAIEKSKLFLGVSSERTRLNDLVSNVPGVVWETWGAPDDIAQRIDFVSKHIQSLLGYSTKQWTSTPNFWLQVVHPGDRERAAKEARDMFESGNGGISRFRWITKRGKPIWVEAHSFIVKDKKNKPIGMRGVTMDITERMEIEKRKDEFISIASHELKTPLTSLQVYTQLLEDQLEAKEDTFSLKYVRRMEQQIDKLNRLVEELLDVSKIQRGRLDLRKEEFNIVELIEETLEQTQAMAKEHEVVLKNKYKKVMVNADKDRINQVLFNLLSNAMKYSPKSKKIEVGINKKNGEIIVNVQDFGVGIEHQYHEKIFERFYRVFDDTDKTYPGLGMGLYIAKVIIKRHGGNLWVESNPGKGSTFYFSLPLKNG